ncbi:DUF2250 domain-containing protein [Natronocalculus amylovorans]|uniref:DUF2250 domain-containing protein n=1 Tax=Natronocalculus amylovorans TaxID=2917812 RepID=A0AAE3FY13_9EURY|nr:DUF2250 domain-containing protein [Natronocalculus amylovorans]MCL9816739.1 DUF2250 domain-containing protein [Natronocalculus amylovorans]NUE01186.1 DUF2250 domain-containing protein [Halorubraceae archaeon YAN]
MSIDGDKRGGVLNDADRRVLIHLRDFGAEYPALVASNTGLHIPLVERHCQTLAQRGLIEAVSGEIIYRITDQGIERLEALTDQPRKL